MGSNELCLGGDILIMGPELSVVFGTYNRFGYLTYCVDSIRRAVGDLSYELVIVDGGSTDGSLDYLREQPDVRLLEHGGLRGCVRAYNDGFAMANGKNVCYLNDDVVVFPETLTLAHKLLEDDPRVGLVALRYSNPGDSKLIMGHTTVGSKRYPFASFGMLPRKVGASAGWFNGYVHYFGDCHLSLSVVDMGYKFVALNPPSGVKHLCADNGLRGTCRWVTPYQTKKVAVSDGNLFHKHWDTWSGPVDG